MNNHKISRTALEHKKVTRCGLLLALTLCFFAAPSLAQTPTWSRGIQNLSISNDECKNRARRALEAEGYTIGNQGGSFSGDYYFGGYKDIHNAVIACNSSPDGKTWANIFVASCLGTGDGNVPGAERVKLQQRMDQPDISKVLVGTWEGVSGDGRFREVWTITENNGQWSVSGAFYDRQTGQQTGGFRGENVRFQSGVLSFRMIFAPKPHPSWANSVEFSSVTVSGDNLTSRHEYGTGTLTRRR
jgi:hypothetical protein